MADIVADAVVSFSAMRNVRGMVFTTSSVGYWFYSQDTSGDLVYTKTTDGGASWGAPVTVNANNTIGYGIWWDQDTPGDTTGTIIYISYFDTVADDVLFKTLDSNGDTLSSSTTIFSGASVVGGRGNFVSITKTVSGYLYCAYDIDAGAEKGFHRSTDAGATWGASLDATFVEATLDQCFLFPASNTGDGNDCWALYHDASANDLTLKMWDSSGAVASESASIMTLTENVSDGVGPYGFSGAVRKTDGHIIVAAVSEYDTATSDHRIFDINGTGSITEKTAITTDIDDHYYPAVFIDQITNDIYVAYNGKRDGSETLGTSTKIYYTKSTDGGASWSAGDTAYMVDTAAAILQVYTPLSGQRFYVGWVINGGTTGTLMGNYTNSIDLYTPTIITATKGAFSWAGKSAPVNVAIVSATVGAFSWAGKTSPIAANTVAATVGAFSWAGTTATLSSMIDATKGAFSWAGKSSSVGTGGQVSTTPGTFSWAGKSSSLSTSIVATKGTFSWAGKTSILGASVTSLRSWRITKYDTATSKVIPVTGLTTVEYMLYNPSTGLTFDFSDNTFKSSASCTTPQGAMSERITLDLGGTNLTAGVYDILLATTGLSGLYQEYAESYGTNNYFSENPVRFQDGVEYLGGLTVSEAASLTAVEQATDTLEARLPAALVGGRMDCNVGAVNGATIAGSGTAVDPWGP